MADRLENRSKSDKCVSKRQAGIGEWEGILRIGLTLLIIGGVPLAGVTISGVDEGLAQTSEPAPLAGFQSGLVTGKQGTTLAIDNKNYQLTPGVSVKDEEGNQKELSDVVPGVEVMFHLKQGRIDQLVLILPK
ncbi:MAG: hypothetical protein AAB093_06655, partial [Nitrospirota bacterium]